MTRSSGPVWSRSHRWRSLRNSTDRASRPVDQSVASRTKAMHRSRRRGWRQATKRVDAPAAGPGNERAKERDEGNGGGKSQTGADGIEVGLGAAPDEGREIEDGPGADQQRQRPREPGKRSVARGERHKERQRDEQDGGVRPVPHRCRAPGTEESGDGETQVLAKRPDRRHRGGKQAPIDRQVASQDGGDGRQSAGAEGGGVVEPRRFAASAGMRARQARAPRATSSSQVEIPARTRRHQRDRNGRRDRATGRHDADERQRPSA